MRGTDRRTFLKFLGGAAGAAMATTPLVRALAHGDTTQSEEFFIFIHAAGGWDITLGLDPRNESRGIIDPATESVVNAAAMRRWVPKPLPDGEVSFEFVRAPGSDIPFGPAIGNVLDMADRLCLINGINMSTVSHPDGTFFSSTGRHLSGGRATTSSIDAIVADASGRGQLLPTVSIGFPSAFLGLDPRAVPLRVPSVSSMGKSLTRSNAYTTEADRAQVTALLTEEARDLAKLSYYADVPEGFALQFAALERMLQSKLADLFTVQRLRAAQPTFNYGGGFQGGAAVNLAFAVEAMRRNIVRCVSLSFGGFDTHAASYRDHGTNFQESADLLATLLQVLDATPHPTLTGERLSEHTHIMVFSDFCRTPQINLSNGRDHYPNNSTMIFSPKFRGGTVFGASDAEQLLPMDVDGFAERRPVAPPDVIATFLHAVGVEPRKYLRDGEVIERVLRS